MSDCVLKVEKLENGYTVEIIDPEIQKANDDPKSKQWKDPWKEYAFTTAEEVKNFVGEQLDSLKPPPDADMEMKAEFKRQAAKADGE